MGLTVAQVVADLRLKLGVMPGYAPPDGADADCISAINWALQVISKSGGQYFNRESISVTLVDDQREYALSADVMDVLGPILPAGSRMLRKVEALAAIEQFGQIYLGQQNAVMANGAPMAFHVRDARTSGGDSHSISLFIAPAPDASAVTAHSPLRVDGVKVCPRYTEASIISGTVVPIADGYAEALLLPLARMQVTRSHLFSRPELLARIQEDASMAMQMLGIEPTKETDAQGERVKQ